EVGQLWCRASLVDRQQDVGRLEVAVDDAVLMGMLHRLGHTLHDLRRLPRQQRPVTQPLLQAAARHQRHREEMLAIDRADLEDRYDSWRVQAGSGPGLTKEALDGAGGGELPGDDGLDSDGALESELMSTVDDAHAATGDRFQQLIVAEAAR